MAIALALTLSSTNRSASVVSMASVPATSIATAPLAFQPSLSSSYIVVLTLGVDFALAPRMITMDTADRVCSGSCPILLLGRILLFLLDFLLTFPLLVHTNFMVFHPVLYIIHGDGVIF